LLVAAAGFTLPALGGCAWLDAQQRLIVYRPTPGRPDGFDGLRPGDQAFDREIVTAEPTRTRDGTVLPAGERQQVRLWWLPQANPRAPTLLYLHGTFRNLYQNLPKIDALREAGFAILAVEYRGWGSSTPIVPAEATIYADAALGWQALVERQPDPRRRVVYGHSMGGGVAVELASGLRHGHDYGALVLESTFTRMPDVARGAGVVLGAIGAFISSQRFDSIDKIARVDAPLLVIHGTADDTVPFDLGRRLYEAARPPKRLVAIDGGGHSRLQRDAPQAYQAALRELIASLE
jgi:pimeloyl-ACP methyl ester carboxylesterase